MDLKLHQIKVFNYFKPLELVQVVSEDEELNWVRIKLTQGFDPL